MGEACSVHWGDEKCVQNFKRKGGGLSEDICVDARIILKSILGTKSLGLDLSGPGEGP